MRWFISSAVLLLATAAASYGQDLSIDGGNSKVVQVDQVTIVKVDKLVVQTFPFTVKAPPGAFDYRWSYPPAVSALDMGDSLQIQKAPQGDVTVGCIIKTIDFEKKKVDSKFQSIAFAIGTPTPVPPTPLPPEPKPPEPQPPTPTPLTSFRVIFVYESSKTLTKEQNSVMHGKVVRDWLTKNTTPENGWAGWREWDKDTNATNETPTMKSLWDAVQPKVTAVPCVAIERNGVVEIIPLAATPAEMVATFEKYKGGK